MLYQQLGVLCKSRGLVTCKSSILFLIFTQLWSVSIVYSVGYTLMCVFCLKIVYVFKHSVLVLLHFYLTQGCVFKSLKGLAFLHKMSQQISAVIKMSLSSPLLSFIINCSDIRVCLIACNLQLIEISENYKLKKELQILFAG